MIVVRASAGLVIEFGTDDAGRWNALSVRLAEGLSADLFRFEVSEGAGRLLVRALDAREPAELIIALGAVLRHEEKVLAEVRKYNRPRE